MKIHVKDMNSYEARVARRSMHQSELLQLSDLECEGNVLVTQAFLSHKGSDEQFRPYLRLMGEVQSISGDFPDGVTEVVFSDTNDCPTIDYRYDFTNEELSDLCKKGLFDEGFSIPRIFIRNNFELPMNCDVCMVRDTEVPVMFVGIRDPYNQEISHQTSGYRLADYFEQAKLVDKTFVDDIMDYQADVTDMFHQDEPDVLEPVSEEIYAEPTERDKLLHKVLKKAEEYTRVRVSERAKFLAEHCISEEEEEEKQQQDVSKDMSESEVSEPIVTISDELTETEDTFDEIVGMVEQFESEQSKESDFVDFEDELSDEEEVESVDADESVDIEVSDDVVSEDEKETEQKLKKQTSLKVQQETMEEEEAKEEIHREVPTEFEDIAAAAEETADADHEFGE